ncbi:MAG: response regulator [Gemmatimonadetes bacterium]|nr:response regulator [Gemmatimonadota bacterium]
MDSDSLSGARVLIVDDENANVLLLQRILQRAGFEEFKSTTDSRHVLPLFTEFKPDLVLLDLHMPHLDGYAVMDQLHSRIGPSEYLPILVLTADVTAATKQRALSAGARDFLTKPLDATEVVLRIRNLLETRSLHQVLQNQNVRLEEKVRERTAALQEAQLEILARLASAAEYRDDDTGEHAQRVGSLAGFLAGAIGLSEEQSELIRLAAPLHDVGKIGIPDAILLKPGALTADEYEVMKTHTTIGARILSGSRSPMLQLAEEIALYHHEKWDGTGYAGLRSDGIPVPARLVAVADVFDALTHERPYRNALSMEDAITYVRDQSGRHFDPSIAELFLDAPGNVVSSARGYPGHEEGVQGP